MMQMLKNNRGFSLIEVVASIVIITIILLAFSQFFIQSNKTAAYNIEKLVLINLADASLERVQAISFSNEDDLDDYISNLQPINFNGNNYTISIEKTTKEAEKNLNLIHLKVTAQLNKSKSVAEGYVKIKN